jgi:ketosteroid isomerase-like protein
MSKSEIVKGLYQSFGAGDVPTVLGAMSADIEWREAEGNPYKMDGEPFVGPDAVLQGVFIRLGEEWERFIVSPRTFHDAGETVVVEVRYTGTYKATGRDLNAQACHVWKLENGKVKSFQQYADTAQSPARYGGSYLNLLASGVSSCRGTCRKELGEGRHEPLLYFKMSRASRS